MDRSASTTLIHSHTARLLSAAIIVGGLLLFRPGTVSAHCDTMDGPVVNAARDSLASGNPNFMLIWVQPKDEKKMQRLFRRVLRRRAAKDGEEVDLKLFEALVRMHREGEGAPFTGLKPAGEVEPSIAALDRSLTEGTADPLVHELPNISEDLLRQHVAELLELRVYDPNDLDAGREYVEAYVTFAHKVEALAGGGEAHDEHHAR